MIKNGDPVLDAQRVDVDYALRDVFPGGAAPLRLRRDRDPVAGADHHPPRRRDADLQPRRRHARAAPPAPTRKAAEPYYFTVRVRNGVIRLVDKAPLQADLAYQQIEHVSIDASVKSDARTTARVDGVLLGRRPRARR